MVWDVTSREPLRSCIQSAISDVSLRYHPWATESEAFWCTRVSISFGEHGGEVLMGDRQPSGTDLVPSADNIAVLLDPDLLPQWERTDDLV